MDQNGDVEQTRHMTYEKQTCNELIFKCYIEMEAYIDSETKRDVSVNYFECSTLMI